MSKFICCCRRWMNSSLYTKLTRYVEAFVGSHVCILSREIEADTTNLHRYLSLIQLYLIQGFNSELFLIIHTRLAERYVSSAAHTLATNSS